VAVIFRDHGPGFYVAAVIVYSIYRSMGEARRGKSLPNGASPSPRIETSQGVSAASGAISDRGQGLSEWSPGKSVVDETAPEASTEEPHFSASEVAANPPDDQPIEFSSTQDFQDEKAETSAPLDEPDEPEHLMKVRSFTSPPEAHLAAGLLRSMGIRCLVTGDSQFVAGHIALFVNHQDIEVARNALNETSAQQDRTSKQSSKGTPWGVIAAAGVLILLVVGIPVYQMLTADKPDSNVDYSVLRRENHPAVSPADFSTCAASVAGWVNEALQAASTKENTALSSHRVASIKWFCSREWNQDLLSRDASALEANGLTFCQVLAAVDPQNPRMADCNLSGVPDNFKTFFVVFDSVPVVELMEERIHPLPLLRTGGDARVLGPVIKRTRSDLQERILRYTSKRRLPFDYYEELALADQPARNYNFTRHLLNVRIITTIGLHTSFRDLYDGAYSSSNITSTTWHSESPILSAIEPESEIDTNVSIGLICMAMDMLVMSSMELIQSHPERGFRSPRMIGEFKVTLLGASGLPTDVSNQITEREGWYDPDAAALGVTSVVGLDVGNKRSLTAMPKQIQELVPAALSHEIYHHIFYRPAIASSGFELEGEATAYGEYEHQMAVLGTHASMDDPIMVLSRKIGKQMAEKLSEETIDKIIEERSELSRMFEERYKTAKFTPVQCSALKIVSSASASHKSFDLADALTLTPGDLQNRQDVLTLYAFAWAIYHHANLNGRTELVERMEKIHDKQHTHTGISDEDRLELDKIVNEIVQWARAERKRRSECQ
jgi:hypothetical protein